MNYIKGEISLELSNILDEKLKKMLTLILEFNSEIIGEVNYEFPSVISTSEELRESLIEKINLYSEMYNNIKITRAFEVDTDNKLVKDFNLELEKLIKISSDLIDGIQRKKQDILKESIKNFEILCKSYDEKVVKTKKLKN